MCSILQAGWLVVHGAAAGRKWRGRCGEAGAIAAGGWGIEGARCIILLFVGIVADGVVVLYLSMDAQQEVMEQLFEVNMLKVSLSALAKRLLPWYLSRSMILVPGKKSPQAGVKKTYGEISARV